MLFMRFMAAFVVSVTVAFPAGISRRQDNISTVDGILVDGNVPDDDYQDTTKDGMTSVGDLCPNDGERCCPSVEFWQSSPPINDPTIVEAGLWLFMANSFVCMESSDLPADSLPCCPQALECFQLGGLGIPFCYDPFMADFYFLDGPRGNMISGSYNASSGDFTNFQSGEYMLRNGTSGNIYARYSSSELPVFTFTRSARRLGKELGTTIPAAPSDLLTASTYTIAFQRTTELPNTVYWEEETEDTTEMELPERASTMISTNSTIVRIIPGMSMSMTITRPWLLPISTQLGTEYEAHTATLTTLGPITTCTYSAAYSTSHDCSTSQTTASPPSRSGSNASTFRLYLSMVFLSIFLFVL